MPTPSPTCGGSASRIPRWPGLRLASCELSLGAPVCHIDSGKPIERHRKYGFSEQSGTPGMPSQAGRCHRVTCPQSPGWQYWGFCCGLPEATAHSETRRHWEAPQGLSIPGRAIERLQNESYRTNAATGCLLDSEGLEDDLGPALQVLRQHQWHFPSCLQRPAKPRRLSGQTRRKRCCPLRILGIHAVVDPSGPAGLTSYEVGLRQGRRWRICWAHSSSLG